MSDTITPFLIDRAGVRGRIARLGTVADTILGRYPYPPAVAQMLGELLLVAAMLSANLKQEGIFTLQLRGNSPVNLMVVDAAHGGQLRGFAEIADKAAAEKFSEIATPRAVFGNDAYLAITLDPGPGMQRYQGVVALEGASIAETVTDYFTQSQQLDVALKLAVARGTPAIGDTHWRAGGIMIERLPESVGVDAQEGWAYARAITGTIKNEELLAPLLEAPELLYRLFHEQGVWVYDPLTMNATCRCSRERMQNLLRSMTPQEKVEMLKDGAVNVHCQFCNGTETFSAADLGVATD